MGARMKQQFEDLGPDEINYEIVQSQILSDNTLLILVQLSDDMSELTRTFLYQIDNLDPETARPIYGFSDFGVGFFADSLASIHLLENDRAVHSNVSGSWTNALIGKEMLYGISATQKNDLFLFGKNGALWSNPQKNREWHEIETQFSKGIFAVARHPDGNLYMAGDYGLFARYDGLKVYELDVGGNEYFKAIDIADDGRIFLAGENVCLCLRDEERHDYNHENTNFHDIHFFKGRRFWGNSGYGLYVEESNELVPFLENHFTHRLCSNKNFMCAVGGKKLHLFDGKTWSGFTISMSDNGVVFSN